MEYICHHDFDGMTESGQVMHISAGTVLPVIGRRIAKDNASVCTVTSDAAYRYFARNDDGKGMERGKLTFAIAFSRRVRKHEDGRVFRFSKKEQEKLLKDWGKFLIDDPATILFNHSFFNADVRELRRMASAFSF